VLPALGVGEAVRSSYARTHCSNTDTVPKVAGMRSGDVLRRVSTSLPLEGASAASPLEIARAFAART
jgi:hypothetical protein